MEITSEVKKLVAASQTPEEIGWHLHHLHGVTLIEAMLVLCSVYSVSIGAAEVFFQLHPAWKQDAKKAADSFDRFVSFGEGTIQQRELTTQEHIELYPSCLYPDSTRAGA